jgi:hypothetical protein
MSPTTVESGTVAMLAREDYVVLASKLDRLSVSASIDHCCHSKRENFIAAFFVNERQLVYEFARVCELGPVCRLFVR